MPLPPSDHPVPAELPPFPIVPDSSPSGDDGPPEVMPCAHPRARECHPSSSADGDGSGSGIECELQLAGSNDVPAGQLRVASFRGVVVEYLDLVTNVAQDRYESSWVEKALNMVLV